MIRFAREEDIPRILAIYEPYVRRTAYTFACTMPTPEEMTALFRTVTKQFAWLVWEQEGQVLGYAYGSAPFEREAYRFCAEVSIYLDPRLHRQGVGRRLYRALEALLWRQGYQVIYALVTDENTKSLAFHEAMGYRRVAYLPRCGFKFGRWCGVVYLEKRSETGEIPSKEPESVLSIVNSDRKLPENLDILSLP